MFYPETASFEDSLRSEKWAFIGGNLLMLFIETMVVSGSLGLGGAAYGAGFIGFIFIGGLRFAMMYFVLFGKEIWAKWTCLGCNSCGILALLPVIFMGPTLSQLGSGSAGSGGPPSSAQIYGEHPWLAIVDIAIGAWLIYLLYRDIQNRQSYV